jgi:hypothetical protein
LALAVRWVSAVAVMGENQSLALRNISLGGLFVKRLLK